MPCPLAARHRRILAAFALVVSAVIASAPLAAHDFRLTPITLEIGADGTLTLDVQCDLDALALGAAPSTDDAELAAQLAGLDDDTRARREAGLERMLTRRLRLRGDGEPLDTTASLPERTAGVHVGDDGRPTVLGTTARLGSRLPAGATTLTLSVSRGFPPAHVTLVDRRTGHVERQVLDLGGTTEVYRLDAPPENRGRLRVASRYLGLGFRHIVPAGPDHVLFVLGLFLLSTAWGPLLWQITAFTVAHTATLALASFGVVSLPAHIVEPLIAASIVYVAVENLFSERLSRARPVAVFVFGLLHGLGFAGVLGDLGLPRPALTSALIGFNVGVELGQLAVIAAAFVVLGAFRHRPWYRRRIAMPLSMVIAAVGLFWFVERVLG